MDKHLLELSAKILLQKIGQGNHIPGSGSAAAFNGILACELLNTVIQLTVDNKRIYKYRSCSSECSNIQEDIVKNILPRLEYLFQEDSDQFDRAIVKRNLRDLEKNQAKKNQLDQQALFELRKSTELPLEIAEKSIQLAKYSLFIFDNGFKSARGDSGVALSNSLSSIAGCLAIISLNLQSFSKNDWTEKIKAQRNFIRNEYIKLMYENSSLLDLLDKEAELKNELIFEIDKIRITLLGKTKISYSDIEKLARKIQNTLWKYKELIWKDSPPSNLLDILNAKKVIKLLDYAYNELETLGVTNLNEEIAGIIDNERKEISISQKYLPEVKNFTTAHELGHALIHDKLRLHRDKPLDGSENSKSRPMEELQADKFASFFLMPRKLVIQKFEELFGTSLLIINEETAFAIANCSSIELRAKIQSLREFSRLIAKTNFYYKPINSLSSVFNVSIEAMAIRIEELELIKL